MQITREELDSFHPLAVERIARIPSAASLDELLMEWQDQRERASIEKAIRRGLADVDAGRYQPAGEAMRDIAREFGLADE